MAASPHVWILWRSRKGDLDQMLSLVKAVGWTHEIKPLEFRGPGIPALAPLLLAAGSDPLTAPWPDVVMCAEALPSIIARHLKQKSGGRLKTVCIGRPAGTPDAFDLVITTPQYRIPSANNVVELSLPLVAPRVENPQPPHQLVKHRPLIAVLVGGASFPDRLDGPTAKQLIHDVRPYTERLGGTMTVLTSPRTGADAIAALGAEVKAPHRLHVFGQGENQYHSLLAAADQIIVTSDSVSMVADGLETGKPICVYRLPQSLGLQWTIARWLYTQAIEQHSRFLRPIRWLFDAGVFEAPADRRLLFEGLVSERRIGWFGGEQPKPQSDAGAHNLARAAECLRALFS